MKISAIISKDIIKTSDAMKDRLNIKVFSVIALALLSGTLLYILSENHLIEEMRDSFTNFYGQFTSKSKTEVFTGILLAHLPYVVLMIILGSSTVGYLLIPLLSYIKITGIGVLNSYLYSAFGLKGLEYSLLIFFPGKFLMLFSVIFLMQCCIDNSVSVKNIIKGESRVKKNGTYYLIRITVAVLLLALSALIDCILAVSFSSLFSF